MVRSRLVGGGEPVEPGVLVVELVAVAGHGPQGGTKAGRPVAGQTDQAGLLVEGPADGLADPEGGVGGELEALAPVELVDRVLEAEVALLDEIEQLHARGQGVAAGHTHHEPQIGADETVLGGVGVADGAVDVAALLAGLLAGPGLESLLDHLGELTLFLGVEERHGADFVQVLSDRITHDISLNGHRRRGIPKSLVSGGRRVPCDRSLRAPHSGPAAVFNTIDQELSRHCCVTSVTWGCRGPTEMVARTRILCPAAWP